jgi:hypothetical protein
MNTLYYNTKNFNIFPYNSFQDVFHKAKADELIYKFRILVIIAYCCLPEASCTCLIVLYPLCCVVFLVTVLVYGVFFPYRDTGL